MKYSAKDIEVFVLTYNRADFLDQTLRSLLAQTEKGFRLVVLDNGSDDHTPDVIKRYEEYQIETIRNDTNVGVEANFGRAKMLAKRKWSMVFHDDDLLHPSYLEAVLGILNRDNDVVLVGSGMECNKNPKLNWKRLKGRIRKFNDVSDFAAFLFNGFGFNFGSAVYRTDLFKKIPVRWALYGKIADRPFLFDVATHGSIAVCTEPYVKYRLHPGQDIMATSNGPFKNELIAMRKKYYNLLGDDLFSKNGRIFLANSYRGMSSEVKRLKDITLKEYLEISLKEGALSKRAVVVGKMTFPLIYIRDQYRRVAAKLTRYYNSVREEFGKEDLLKCQN